MSEQTEASDTTPPQEVENENEQLELQQLYSEATQAASQKDYDTAIQNYKQILQSNENNGKVWSSLGYCYLLAGRYKDSHKAYQKALYTNSDKTDPYMWYGIGLLYSQFNLHQYSEPAFHAVLKTNAEFEHKEEILYRLGNIYKKARSYDNAITYLRHAITSDSIHESRKVDALCNIGFCLEMKNQVANAVVIYREANSIEPDNI